MNDRELNDLTPDQARAREAVRSLPVVEADPGFRERLKADFVAGRLGLEQEPGRSGRRRAARRRGGAWWLLIPSAVAALVVGVLIFNGGPPPDLAAVTGEGTVTVDGRAFPTAERGAIAKAIGPGVRVEVSDGVDFDLVYGGTMAVRLSSGAATIPAAPARWFGRTGGCMVERGELNVLTGPGFRGGHLVMATGEGIVEITGTLVSVFRDSSITCVCVQEGKASVGVDAGDMEPVPAGMRKVMFADGSPPMLTDIAPPHRDHLIAFEREYGPIIRRDR
jgi:hypothetical protein